MNPPGSRSFARIAGFILSFAYARLRCTSSLEMLRQMAHAMLEDARRPSSQSGDAGNAKPLCALHTRTHRISELRLEIESELTAIAATCIIHAVEMRIFIIHA